MIDLPGVSSLELVAERLGGLRAFVLRRGDPGRIAGNPAGIRRLAEHHRASAGRLGTVAALGQDRVSHMLAGSWQGEASARFGGYWSDMERRIDALAAAHQGMAKGLEQVAEESAPQSGGDGPLRKHGGLAQLRQGRSGGLGRWRRGVARRRRDDAGRPLAESVAGGRGFRGKHRQPVGSQPRLRESRSPWVGGRRSGSHRPTYRRSWRALRS
jgi:uncharacterized protein YukE